MYMNTNAINYVDENTFRIGDQLYDYLEIPRLLSSNSKKIKRNTEYNVKVYSKNSYLNRHSNLKDKIIEEFLKKKKNTLPKLLSDMNLKHLKNLDKEMLVNIVRKFHPYVPINITRKIINENYTQIILKINNIILSNNKKDLIDIVKIHLFDNPIIHENFKKLLIHSTEMNIKKIMGMNMNHKLMIHYLDNCFLHSNEENMGIVYQTQKYINQEIFGNSSSACPISRANNRKLEYCGYLSLIIRDKNSIERDLKTHADYSINKVSSELFNDPKIQIYRKLFSPTNTFPVLNILKMIEDADLDTNQECDRMYNNIIELISKNICFGEFFNFFMNKLLEGNKLEEIFQKLEDEGVISIPEINRKYKTEDRSFNLELSKNKLIPFFDEKLKIADEKKYDEYMSKKFRKSNFLDSETLYENYIGYNIFLDKTLGSEFKKDKVTNETVKKFEEKLSNPKTIYGEDNMEFYHKIISRQYEGITTFIDSAKEKYGNNFKGFIKTPLTKDIKDKLRQLAYKYDISTREYFGEKRFPLISFFNTLFLKFNNENKKKFLIEIKKYIMRNNNSPINAFQMLNNLVNVLLQ